MTAMPPTKGHVALIDFASRVANNHVVRVILCTQPSEPFSIERRDSLVSHFAKVPGVYIHTIHREMEQNADAPGFWNMWRNIMFEHGFTENDVVVSSESYGQRVADLFGAKFMPYDPGRELQNIKATRVRNNPVVHFDEMIPEFQKYLRKTITVFGAESVGKTTLSRAVAERLGGHWRYEYARPYLEMMGNEITDKKMFDIFDGQEAIQKQARHLVDKPFIIQDTDLFSTIGYWEMWKDARAPQDWEARAHSLKSDLYIILTQNIPFEADPLRYGGDKRESTDKYWIDLCERENLNYLVVDGDGKFSVRVYDTVAAGTREFHKTARALSRYTRRHNG
jgi:NadR type nicotinamide-nucleotide adenylyltransferase